MNKQMKEATHILILMILISVSGIVPQVEAAVAELDILKDQDVSIADLHEVPITEASGNVYVITDEDIRHSGATDIPTLLRRIPGMEVMQMTAADFNVSVRGNNQQAANKLLVLVDGRSIYEDSFGSVFWTLLPVTLPEIKRIEVMKGPASALYGFNAFDGVVNIVTKSPEEMKGNTNGTHLQFGGGEFGTIRSSAIQAGSFDKIGYRLSFGHDQNQEWSDRNSLSLRSNKFNVLTEYHLVGDSKVALSGGLVDSNRFEGQVFDVVHENSKIKNGYAQLEYKRPDFFIRGNWIRWDQNRQESPDFRLTPFVNVFTSDGNPNEIYKQDGYNLESQHAVHIGTANRFTYGFNFRHNDVSANFLDQSFVQEERFGLYFQDEWRATETLTAVAGLRWDLHSNINPTYSPRVAVIYKPLADHSLRVSVSQAYRPPTVIERHANAFFKFPTFPGFVTHSVGSPNLIPEKITSYELGYQGWFFKHRLRLRADVFYNHLDDFITGSVTGQTVSFVNAGRADIWGGESGVEFLVTSWLTGFANYSFVNVWQNADSPTRQVPAYKINAGLRGEWENGLSGEVAVHHVAASSMPIPFLFGFFATTPPPLGGAGLFPPLDPRVGAYTLLNMRAAYEFWRERAEVAVSVFNALNDHHRENPVGDAISSRVMGWLTLRY